MNISGHEISWALHHIDYPISTWCLNILKCCSKSLTGDTKEVLACHMHTNFSSLRMAKFQNFVIDKSLKWGQISNFLLGQQVFQIISTKSLLQMNNKGRLVNWIPCCLKILPLRREQLSQLLVGDDEIRSGKIVKLLLSPVCQSERC